MLAAVGGRSEMVKLLLHRHKATVDEKIRYVGYHCYKKARYMWQSRVEIEHYFVGHFDLITAFKAL